MRISDWSSDVCSSDLFEHRELRVVPGAHALVAEVAVDLVHALEGTDDQALEVELRRHAQAQVQAERVVMRGDRLGRRTTGPVMHHRRLDFQEASLAEPAKDRADHLRALRSAESRVGKEDVSTGSSRVTPLPEKKKE